MDINGLNLNFSDQSFDDDGTIVAWEWDFGDGVKSTQRHPSHTYNKAGSYDVKLTVTDNDGAKSTVLQTINAS